MNDQTSKKLAEAHDEITEDANKAVDRVHVHDVITRRGPDLSKACVTVRRLTDCCSDEDRLLAVSHEYVSVRTDPRTCRGKQWRTQEKNERRAHF